MGLKELLSFTITAMQAAGDIVKKYYRADYATWDKGIDDPVTVVDLEVDRLLRQQLMNIIPGCGWLSEETVDTPDRLDKRCVWVVDPIDGTREFIDGVDEFAISIGYVEDGKPVLGVVYNPGAEEMVAGAIGLGVSYNGEPARPLSEHTEPRGARVLASATEFRKNLWSSHEGKFDLEPVGGTAYKLARLAAGFGDAYITLDPRNEWDICGGVALVLAAGGQVTDLKGRAVYFNQADTLSRGLVAANPRLHTGILELLKK